MDLIHRAELMPRDIEDQIRQHGIDEYPNEAIGVISRGKYIRIKNVSKNPSDFATPDPETYQNLLMDGAIDALVHSHPDGNFCPSGKDMMAQRDHDIPYGVYAVYGDAATRVALWGDNLVRPDLLDRGFQHGITDCYDAIRDRIFEERKMLILQFPRTWRWWEDHIGDDLYMDGFMRAGFEKIPAEESLPGDGVIFKIRYNFHNHAGLLISNDLLYHHPTSKMHYSPNHKAGIVPIERYLKHEPVFVRLNENHPSIRHFG